MAKKKTYGLGEAFLKLEKRFTVRFACPNAGPTDGVYRKCPLIFLILDILYVILIYTQIYKKSLSEQVSCRL